MTGPLPVTVIVPTKDEATNLPGCLQSLGSHFSEVIVVDSDSADETPRIAAEHGARVEAFLWNGRFPKKRNWALDNLSINTDWVLFLDADERVTNGFLEELGQALRRGGHVGFWLRYNNWFFGKKLRHGDPMRKLALFRHEAGRYERLPSSSGVPWTWRSTSIQCSKVRWVPSGRRSSITIDAVFTHTSHGTTSIRPGSPGVTSPWRPWERLNGLS